MAFMVLSVPLIRPRIVLQLVLKSRRGELSLKKSDRYDIVRWPTSAIFFFCSLIFDLHSSRCLIFDFLFSTRFGSSCATIFYFFLFNFRFSCASIFDFSSFAECVGGRT